MDPNSDPRNSCALGHHGTNRSSRSRRCHGKFLQLAEKRPGPSILDHSRGTANHNRGMDQTDLPPPKKTRLPSSIDTNRIRDNREPESTACDESGSDMFIALCNCLISAVFCIEELWGLVHCNKMNRRHLTCCDDDDQDGWQASLRCILIRSDHSDTGNGAC